MLSVDHFFNRLNSGSDESFFTNSTNFNQRLIDKSFWNKVATVDVDNFVSQYSLGYNYWEFDNNGKIQYGEI